MNNWNVQARDHLDWATSMGLPMSSCPCSPFPLAVYGISLIEEATRSPMNPKLVRDATMHTVKSRRLSTAGVRRAHNCEWVSMVIGRRYNWYCNSRPSLRAGRDIIRQNTHLLLLRGRAECCDRSAVLCWQSRPRCGNVIFHVKAYGPLTLSFVRKVPKTG